MLTIQFYHRDVVVQITRVEVRMRAENFSSVI